MAPPQNDAFRKAEARARNAEEDLLTRSGRAVLDATIDAAELYMRALRLADNSSDRKRVDDKCKFLLTQAESLKRGPHPAIVTFSDTRALPAPVIRLDMKQPSSTRKLTTRENIIILEGSRLNGFLFRPWVNAPDPMEFELRDGEQLFVDSASLPLSPAQLQSFDGWKRPLDALNQVRLFENSEALSRKPTMEKVGKVDLVQDMTSDCSVVASLCAGVSRAERGHQKILGAIVHPYDYEQDNIMLSGNGKYVLRLYFNGCWRRVEIDDFLPTSKNSRVLHVVNRSHPGLLWPALVEKAYLKVRGGYDFPGSNSGTDLAVLTGWIPQQIFLHDEDIEPDGLWSKIYEGFKSGNLLLTMGTGKLPEREQRKLGLAAEHDYSVLEMKEENGTKEMLIKNPWSDGDVWRGAAKRRANPSQEKLEVPSSTGKNAQMTPGTFWMDFSTVFQHFENFYANWNPGLFSRRQDFHFSWDVAASASMVNNLFVDNPQFSISSSNAGEVWLLLNRHFRTGDFTRDSEGKNGFISLYVYDEAGFRVLSSDGAKLRGPFVDSPNTLVTFDIPADKSYTAVVATHDFPAGKHNFTLSAFSSASLILAEASMKYPHHYTVSAAWTRSTAGGNSDSTTYLRNPQFSLKVQADHDLAFVLQTAASGQETQVDVHVKLLVVASDGNRLTRLRPRDVVANSGDYRRGSTMIEKAFTTGKYTVVCSTFDRNQLAQFTLTLYTSSTQSGVLRPLPSESSGRLEITSPVVVFDSEVDRLLAPIRLPRTTKVLCILQTAKHAEEHRSNSLFKLSIEQGQGPYKHTIASSAQADAEFGSLSTGVRIEDVDLRPQMHGPDTGGLWLVLERLAQTSARQVEDLLQVELLAEERVEIGPWGRGDG